MRQGAGAPEQRPGDGKAGAALKLADQEGRLMTSRPTGRGSRERRSRRRCEDDVGEEKPVRGGGSGDGGGGREFTLRRGVGALVQ